MPQPAVVKFFAEHSISPHTSIRSCAHKYVQVFVSLGVV